MAKTPIVPGSPVPIYLWTDSKYRTYPQPTSGGADKLLTLKSSNIGNSTYKYLDWQARYRGAFRVPSHVGGSGAGVTGYSRGAMGYVPPFGSNTQGIMLAGIDVDNIFAEFSIPAPGMQTTRAQISSLPMATVKQQMTSALRGTAMGPMQSSGPLIAGMYSNGQRLLVSIFSYYEQADDFNTPAEVFRDVRNIAGSVVDGWHKTAHPSWTCGPVCPIPLAWQSALGGTHMTGLSNSTGRASNASLSVGPCAASFNANDVLTNSQTIGTGTVTYNNLMKHDLYGILAPTNDALYNWVGGAGGPGPAMNNHMWTHVSQTSGGIIIPGTKTYMILGGSGGHIGGLDYGDPPWGGYKGHFPRDATDTYAYYWLVSLDDLAAVRAGTLAANMVVPYEVGSLWMPFQPTPGTAPFFYITGSGLDETNNLLYLSMSDADNLQEGDPPIITVFDAIGL